VNDSGPGGLSFFTYYFLEATRDGNADWQGKGIITFADLASYLVPRAANSDQTPVWGVLPGDAGGEYIFTAKAHDGSIPILQAPPMPTGADQTRTRGADLAIIVPNLQEMRRPIDNLYRSWEQLDLDAYLKQWTPDARQDFPEHGQQVERNYEQIASARRQDFARLKRVEVPRYQVTYEGFKDGVGKFGAEYSMVFHYKDGRVKQEREHESYEVVQSHGGGPWLIRTNNDYLK